MKKPIFTKPDLSLQNLRLCALQSVLTACFVGLALLAVYLFDNQLWIASLGASAFIAFTFPTAQSARSRVLIGGYCCGSFWGVSAGLIRLAAGITGEGALIAFCIAALFFSALCMTVFDFKHPPSAALAVGIVFSDRPLATGIAAILCILALCLVKAGVVRLFFRVPPADL